MAKIPPFPQKKYDAVVRSEQEDRYFAFLDIERIAGIDVHPLTLRHLAWLNVVRSPFIVGGTIDYAAVMQFVWIVSRDFCQDPEKKAAFFEQSLGVDIETAAKDINDCIDRAFLDCIGGRPSGGIHKTVASTCASICLQMAGEPFNMNWRDCMDVPLGVIFQLLKVKSISEGGPKLNKRSDAVAGKHWECVNKMNQKAKAKAEKEKHG